VNIRNGGNHEDSPRPTKRQRRESASGQNDMMEILKLNQRILELNQQILKVLDDMARRLSQQEAAERRVEVKVQIGAIKNF
jgi:N-acetylglutamate synthase/N-acetylornithine aminotransferase